jgi:hypothetical protein
MRCIILYLNDVEIAEGFGETETEARTDAREQLPSIYMGLNV